MKKYFRNDFIIVW